MKMEAWQEPTLKIFCGGRFIFSIPLIDIVIDIYKCLLFKKKRIFRLFPLIPYTDYYTNNNRYINTREKLKKRRKRPAEKPAPLSHPFLYSAFISSQFFFSFIA